MGEGNGARLLHAATRRRLARPTRLVDARRRLAESEERLALALESSRMGVWDWDVRSGRVLYTLSPGVAWPENPAARADRPVLPEYSELHASDWNVNTHPDDVLLWRGAVEAAVAGVTSTFTTVYRRRTPLGDWIWIEARGKVVARDRRGRATRLVGTFENVTEGMQEETERRRLETSLLQAMRLTAIAEVASGLSHELNQPLSVAMSHVQAAGRMVRNGQPDPAALQKLLADAVAFVERAGEIVRRYRCLASSRAAERETFDIAESARQIVAVLAPDARRNGVSVKMAEPAPARPVVADRIQIEQILANLVRNGIEAAVAGEQRPRQVVVSVEATDRAVHVRVSDTGAGIPESVRDATFTPFFTTKAQGTGLGLPLSRTIAEAHGGRLVLECGEPGRTSFLLTLP